MRPSRNQRLLALAIAAVFAVCGWIGSASGSLAFAAIAERDHVLAISLGDGHLDLVREHAARKSDGDVASPADPDHVVHLCRSIQAASSRPQAAGGAGLGGALVGEMRSVSLPSTRAPATMVDRVDPGARPLKSTVRLL